MADWFRLDNAALIFPVVRKRDWSNAFRVSATLEEDIDPNTLQRAVESLMPRFPSVYVSLHRGFFWFYLEKLKTAPEVSEEMASPLVHMTKKELKKCCFRVLYYKNRIAVEIFHSVTDGTGGLVFLKTLVAVYISMKYKIPVEPGCGVLDPDAKPSAAELEDSFIRSQGPVSLGRGEENSVRMRETKENDGFRHLVRGRISSEAIVSAAHKYKCTVTSFVTAVMLQSIIELTGKNRKNKWVKATIPVNLRKLFGGETMRNFVLTVNVGVDPKLGEYTLDELCRSVQGQLDCEATAKQMGARISANVRPSINPVVRIMPLFVKSIFMRAVYRRVGEAKGSISISNIGVTEYPGAMAPFVREMDFIIGPQSSYNHNCGIITWNKTTYINLIRSCRENDLERHFFTKLVDLGLQVTLDSNERRD